MFYEIECISSWNISEISPCRNSLNCIFSNDMYTIFWSINRELRSALYMKQLFLKKGPDSHGKHTMDTPQKYKKELVYSSWLALRVCSMDWTTHTSILLWISPNLRAIFSFCKHRKCNFAHKALAVKKSDARPWWPDLGQLPFSEGLKIIL